MYCSQCGKKIDDSAAFCSYCGSPTSRPAGQKPAAEAGVKQEKAAPAKKQPIWVTLIIVALVYCVARYMIAPLIVGKPSAPSQIAAEPVTIPTVTVPEFTVPEVTIPVPETVAPVPEVTSAPELTGYWEKVSLKKGSMDYQVSAYSLSMPIRACTEMTVTMDVTMNANTSCKDWELWLRKDGTFKKACDIYLPGGDGSTTQTVYFSPARTFDSVAIIPSATGGYSWSMGIMLSDIICD